MCSYGTAGRDGSTVACLGPDPGAMGVQVIRGVGVFPLAVESPRVATRYIGKYKNCRGQETTTSSSALSC